MKHHLEETSSASMCKKNCQLLEGKRANMGRLERLQPQTFSLQGCGKHQGWASHQVNEMLSPNLPSQRGRGREWRGEKLMHWKRKGKVALMKIIQMKYIQIYTLLGLDHGTSFRNAWIGTEGRMYGVLLKQQTLKGESLTL